MMPSMTDGVLVLFTGFKMMSRAEKVATFRMSLLNLHRRLTRLQALQSQAGRNDYGSISILYGLAERQLTLPQKRMIES